MRRTMVKINHAEDVCLWIEHPITGEVDYPNYDSATCCRRCWEQGENGSTIPVLKRGEYGTVAQSRSNWVLCLQCLRECQLVW